MGRLIRPIRALLKNGGTFNFTYSMEDIVRTLSAKLATPPILILSDWDAVSCLVLPYVGWLSRRLILKLRLG